MKRRIVLVSISMIVGLMGVFNLKTAEAANEGFRSAITLTAGKEESFTIPTIETERWFKVTTTNPDEAIKITIDSEGEKFDGKVCYYLYDDELNSVDSVGVALYGSYAFNTKTIKAFKVNKPSDYYIKIVSASYINPIYYTNHIINNPIFIYYSIISPDFYENNDEMENATPIVENKKMEFTLNGYPDVDWFKFMVNKDDEELTIIIDSNYGTFDSHISYSIFDENKNYVDSVGVRNYASGAIRNGSKNTFKIDKAGIYYIKILCASQINDIYYENNFVEKPIYIISNIGYPGAKLIDGSEYIYDEINIGENVQFDYKDLEMVINKDSAIQAVKDAAQTLTQEQKQSPTGVDLITLFAEEAIAQGSSSSIDGNNIEIKKETITHLQSTAIETKKEIDKALINEGIITAREISTGVKIKTESSKDLKITIDKSILNTEVDKISVESPNISIKIDTDEIKNDLGENPLIITITEEETFALEDNYHLASLEGIYIAATTKKTYTVNFNRAVKENITVSLPRLDGDTRYQAVITSDGEIVGGKYNPAKNTIDVKIKESGKYTVKENLKDFTDIQNKSKEMQDAIKLLASKGIIAGKTATTFDPDGSISRAEIAALIVRTLSKIDKSAPVGFKDIKTNEWFYNVAGSSKKYGIINGYEDNTFRGNLQIKKDQIIAVSARTLRAEMKYKDPTNVSAYLGNYKDNAKIANWAKADIALATRENLVLKRVDGNFTGDDNMTRGDAAIIIKRLFDKLW